MVAELLFSQQPRKLWIMSVAVLGKQVQQSSRQPKVGSDVCGGGCGAQGWEGGTTLLGSSSIRTEERLGASIVKTEELKP